MKKWLQVALLIAAAVAVLLLYPRDCGQKGIRQETTYSDCSCTGFKMEPAERGAVTCYGLAGPKECYTIAQREFYVDVQVPDGTELKDFMREKQDEYGAQIIENLNNGTIRVVTRPARQSVECD